MPEICITTHAQEEENYFKKVCVIGKYTLVNTNKRSDTPIYGAYAMVTYKLGSALLGMGSNAIRPKEEREKLLGKSVKVTGILTPDVLFWGDGKLASPMGTAITDIESIELPSEKKCKKCEAKFTHFKSRIWCNDCINESFKGAYDLPR